MKPNNKKLALALMAAGMLFPVAGSAQTINLQQAVDMSLAADPRIKEREYLVEAARGLLAEVKGKEGWRINANAFIGLAPAVDGGFYKNGAYSGDTPRRDGDDWDGGSDWTRLDFALTKPLYTFGKVEEYGKAAQGNIDVKLGEVRQSKAETVFDTKRAYYGYLTARDIRLFLEDMQSRLADSITRAEHALKEETGEVTQAELYSLQATKGVIGKYVHQARAVESISLDGLRVLTGVGLKAPLKVADDSLEPVPFPSAELADLQAKALYDRPEMQQLEAGLRARRALVAAQKADGMPNIYAGLVGTFSYASQRDQMDNPYIYDPFNSVGLTPVVGIRWDKEFDAVTARMSQAQAELEALNQRKQFALAGIPFEVSEAYANAKANHDAQKDLSAGATSARRWVIASMADFAAGLERGDKLAEAIKSYVLAQTEYLRTVNDYNVNVAQISKLTGEQN
jgi:outer membrane protein TolC